MNKERVIIAARLLTHGYTRGVCQPVARSGHEVIEQIIGVEAHAIAFVFKQWPAGKIHRLLTTFDLKTDEPFSHIACGIEQSGQAVAAQVVAHGQGGSRHYPMTVLQFTYLKFRKPGAIAITVEGSEAFQDAAK